ncbi:MAG: TonB-dependent receptor [Elusimicrobiota bacterium]|jgi:outer membrane receptor protein involved in Fe transport
MTKFIFAACILSALPLYAQDASDSDFDFFQQEAMVMTAGRKPQKLRTVAASVTVFTAEDIQRLGVLSLADLLRLVPGMDVRVSRSATGIADYEVVHVDNRGLNGSSIHTNKRILLLMDGRPVNDYFFGSFDVDERLSMDNIRKIEILKGPASSLYGTNAEDGVIQIFTKSGKTDPGLRVRGSFGSFNTQETGVEYGHEWQKHDASMFVSGRYYQSQGPHLINNNESTYGGNLFLKLDRGPAELSMGYDQGIHQYSMTRSAPSTHNDTHFAEYFANIVTPFKPLETLEIAPRAYWNYYEAQSFLGILTSYRVGTELQATWAFHEDYSLVSGMQLRNNWEDVTDADRHDITEQGYFAQLEMRPLPDLYLQAGGRWDKNSLSPSFFSPRAGLVYTLGENWTLKSSYGKSFRAPNFGEVYERKASGISIAENPELTPEYIQTFESKVEFQAADRHHLGATYFNSEAKDILGLRGPINGLKVLNSGSASIWGIETEISERLLPQLTLYGNHSFQRTTNNTMTQRGTGILAAQVQGQLLYAPEHKFTAGLTLRPRTWLDWDVHNLWVGQRRYSASTLNMLPAYHILSTTLRARCMGHWTASLSVDNISNKYRQETNDVPMPSRAYRGGVEYRF